MGRIIAPAAALAALALATLVGCPALESCVVVCSSTPLAGTWNGTLDCTITESRDSEPEVVSQSTRTVSLNFDPNGIPTRLPIWGPHCLPDLSTVANSVNLTEYIHFTPTGCEPVGGGRFTANIADTTYTSDSARVYMMVEWSATGGGMTRYSLSGAGDMTVETEVDGQDLRCRAVAQYFSKFRAYHLPDPNAVTIWTHRETIECTGTLRR